MNTAKGELRKWSDSHSYALRVKLLVNINKLCGLSPRANRWSDRRLLAKLVTAFADRGYNVVSVMDPYGRILAFLDRCRYLLFLSCHTEESRSPLWSSGQSSWLHNGAVLFPVRYELILNMLCGGCRDPSRCPRGTLYPQMLALTSSTSGSRSV
jgi:hypothetical protein